MGVVWSRCTTFGTIIEDHQLRELVEQFMDLTIVVEYALRLMLDAWDGEVCRQDGVGVDEQVEMVVDGFLRLFFGPVLLAEEAGAFVDDLLFDAGTR